MQRLQLIKYTRYTFYNTGEQRKIPQNLSCFSDNHVLLIKIVSRDIQISRRYEQKQISQSSLKRSQNRQI